jgi:hypothetical protein
MASCADIDPFRCGTGFLRQRQKLLPGATMVPILGKVSQIGEVPVEIKHASLPFALGSGKSVDFNQLVGQTGSRRGFSPGSATPPTRLQYQHRRIIKHEPVNVKYD